MVHIELSSAMGFISVLITAFFLWVFSRAFKMDGNFMKALVTGALITLLGIIAGYMKFHIATTVLGMVAASIAVVKVSYDAGWGKTILLTLLTLAVSVLMLSIIALVVGFTLAATLLMH